MKLIRGFKARDLKSDSIITIGTFDGVHLGHQKIIKMLIEKAKEDNLKSILLTFFPHPRMVLQKDANIKLINTLDEKSEILKELGLDYLVIEEFTQQFSRITAVEFVRDILVNKLGAKQIIIGYNHRFGRNRSANINDLNDFGETFGFKVYQISAEDIDEVAISSTKIRMALSEGDMQKANSFLGYDFMLTGIVTQGKGLGRTIGFPTANLLIEKDYKLIPKNGVYVVSCNFQEIIRYGMMNIGTNPTVNGEGHFIEIHFFDFDMDIYGEKLQVNMHKRLRNEKKFESLEALTKQLNEDRKSALTFLNKMRINKFLFKQIDNSALIVFRMIFGALLFLESVGAIFTGWIKRTLIDPEFTFSFIGLEWLQPLPGNGMYVYYAMMGVFGLMVMLGYKYRLAMIAFTILWSGCYFMQKASYNNHYYLLILISGIMAFLPAHKNYSFDVKSNPSLLNNAMPNWCRWIIILQLLIVYTYASIAKMYPDWLDLTVAKNLMASRKNYPIIGEVIQQQWFLYLIAYAGILFDLLIVPLLLWKPTRKWAFFAAIFFHLFNSIVFQIGIFPYLSLAFTLFFFEPKLIQKLFLKRKQFYTGNEVLIPKKKSLLLVMASIYFVIQIALPLRHWLIEDNVLWTEEGHRLSWRMMLRSKTGVITYRVVNKETRVTTKIKLSDYLTAKQKRIASTKPDVIWQFAQRLKQIYKANGIDISVFVDTKLSINGKDYKPFINPKVDLAEVKWDTFKHSHWILPSE